MTSFGEKLSQRQERLRNLAQDKGYHYKSKIDWDTVYLKNFSFFELRPIERKYNSLNGIFEDLERSWEIVDITFNEGQAFTAETFDTTVMVLKSNKNLPVFSMEKEGVFENIFEKLRELKGNKDIDFEKYPDFSKKFLLMGDNEAEIQSFFTEDLIRFFEKNHVYHIESNGEALIVFDKIKLARTDETIAFINYGKELSELLMK